MSVSVRHRLEYAAVLAIRALARTLPRRAGLAAGGLLGALFHRLHGSRRELAAANLRAAFPERTEMERRTISAPPSRRSAATSSTSSVSTR